MAKVRHFRWTNELRLRETRCQQCGHVCTPVKKEEKWQGSQSSLLTNSSKEIRQRKQYKRQGMSSHKHQLEVTG